MHKEAIPLRQAGRGGEEEIAISVYTVYNHINNIKQKMGIDRTTDLVRYALENPMILSGEQD